jgi:hypothetical protein
MFILLDAATHVPTGFWERLLDQPFAILLSVILNIALWRELWGLKKQVDRYRDEDRREMLEVIQNNTRVMESLKNEFTHR